MRFTFFPTRSLRVRSYLAHRTQNHLTGLACFFSVIVNRSKKSRNDWITSDKFRLHTRQCMLDVTISHPIPASRCAASSYRQAAAGKVKVRYAAAKRRQVCCLVCPAVHGFTIPVQEYMKVAGRYTLEVLLRQGTCCWSNCQHVLNQCNKKSCMWQYVAFWQRQQLFHELTVSSNQLLVSFVNMHLWHDCVMHVLMICTMQRTQSTPKLLDWPWWLCIAHSWLLQPVHPDPGWCFP